MARDVTRRASVRKGHETGPTHRTAGRGLLGLAIRRIGPRLRRAANSENSPVTPPRSVPASRGRPYLERRVGTHRMTASIAHNATPYSAICSPADHTEGAHNNEQDRSPASSAQPLPDPGRT